jgi:alkylhydroperoxidase family enzyme
MIDCFYYRWEDKMWLVPPLRDEDAQGVLRELYDKDVAADGYIPNTTRAWSHRPELFLIWQQLLKGIRANMRLRSYELVTLAAARAIGCVY